MTSKEDIEAAIDQRIDALEQEVAGLEESLEEAESWKIWGNHIRQHGPKTDRFPEQLVGELRSKVVGSAREIALLRERIADLSGRSANNKSEKRLQIAEKRAATTNGSQHWGHGGPM